MMQAVNEAYEALKNFAGEISLDEDSTNFGEELNNAINAIINLDGISIEVCGAWVWVTGETKKHAQALGKKGAGFYYASKKQAWYFRPADFKSRGRGKHSLDEIRAKYGSESVERKSKNKLKAA